MERDRRARTSHRLIKPGYSTGVIHDVFALIERQHAIIPTVEVDERSHAQHRFT
jgi:hypothetical protein